MQMAANVTPKFDQTDAAWMAHRYERTRDEIHFRHIVRADHATFPFLTEEYVGHLPPTPVARVQAVATMGDRQSPLHFIFHSAFCGSTLLCRAFDHHGVAMGLSEPPILNDIVGIRRRQEAAPKAVAQLLDEGMALLAREWAPGEAVIVKPSNIVNPLAAAMLSLRPHENALLLYCPLETFLSSVARKGMWCRLWARELLEGYLTDGSVDLGFAPNDYFRMTDLQCAAVGWLAQQRMFTDLTARFSPSRVRCVDSETMLGDPTATISALAALFEIDATNADIAAMASGPAFHRHSKFGQTFGPEQRRTESDMALAAHGDEIAKVTEWANAVARTAGVPMTLPFQLLG